MQTIDLYTAFDLTVRLVAVGLLVSSVELMTIIRQFNIHGVFSMHTVLPFYGPSRVLKMVDRWVAVLFVVQAFASILLVITGPFSVYGRTMLILCFVATTTTRWRRHLGGDGAEQMNMIVLITALFALFPYPSADRIGMAVLFISAQVILSYCTAGIAKLISPLWRRGEALPAILSTYIHGNFGVSAFLHQHRRLAFIACWSVTIFECLFPVLISGPEWLLWATLSAGLVFHLLCALLMGLNSFLWSFPAVYPCIVYLSY